MNYYSYPYGGAPVDPYYGRVISPTSTMGMEPPYPAGTAITSNTPNPTSGKTPWTTEQFFEAALNPSLSDLVSLTKQQSYVENILRLNKGKLCAVHMTFSGEGPNKTQVFVGEIMGAGRDHILLSDPQTGHNYLLLMVYLDYVDFPEPINYYYPTDGIINIVDEELYDEIPALMTLKKYNEEFKKYKEEQLKKEYNTTL